MSSMVLLPAAPSVLESQFPSRRAKTPAGEEGEDYMTMISCRGQSIRSTICRRGWLLGACVLLCVVAVLVISCTEREGDEAQRTNPYDAGGGNFLYDQPPGAIAVNSGSVQWHDYDFAGARGAIGFTYTAYDPNENYDTLTYTLFLGTRADSLDSVYQGPDSVYYVSGAACSQVFYFRVRATDRSDSSRDTTGSFSAPAGPPPMAPGWEYNEFSSNYIYLEWDTSAGAVGYRVYRAASPGGPYEKIIDTLQSQISYYSSQLYYYDNVRDYSVYYYIVSAYNAYGESRSKDTLASRIYYSGLPSVSLYSVSQGTYEDYVQLSWSSVTSSYSYAGVATYHIYRAVSSGGPYKDIATVAHPGPATSISYNDSVPTGDTYYYRLAAFDSQERGGQLSSYRYGYVDRLPAPYSLSASRGTYSTHVALSWSTVSGALGYYIYRSASSYSTEYELIDSTTATTYNDSVQSTGTMYYRVAAYGSSGKRGELSSYAYGNIAKLPGPDSGSVSNGLYPNCVVLTWKAVAGATGYHIYRAVNSYATSSFTLYATSAAVSFVDSNVSVGTLYYYKIAAYSASGDGYETTPLVGRPMYPVEGFWVDNRDDCLYMQWLDVAYEDGYYVYRQADGGAAPVKAATLGAGAQTYYDSVPDYGVYCYWVAAYNGHGTALSDTDCGKKKPRTPQNFVSTDYATYTVLSWDSCAGAEGYFVLRSATTTPTIYDTTTSTTYVDSNFVSHDRYYYQVAAYNDGGNNPSDNSGLISGGRVAAPSEPLGLAAVGTPEFITLTWRHNVQSSRATGFYVYRASTSGGTYTRIDTVADTTCNDTVPDGNTYYYKVSAYNSQGEGPTTNYAYAKRQSLPAPTGLLAGNGSQAEYVALTWGPVDGAASYVVYRSLTTSSFSAIATVGDTFYNDSSASLSVKYYYRVAASNEVGAGTQSAYTTGWRLSPPPAPTTSASVAHIQITWSAALSAEGYGIYRSTSAAGSYARIDSVASASRTYYDTVTTPSMYYYKISAYFQHNESALSSASSGATRQIPAIPTGLTATDGTVVDTVLVAWARVAGADGYKVYRDTDSSFTSPAYRGATTDTAFFDTVGTDLLYFYRVKSYNGAGESVLSNFDGGFRRPSVAPGAPQNVAASDTSSSFIRVHWSAPSGGTNANGYTVYRSTSETGTYTLQDSTTFLFYIDYVPSTFPTYYWYKIKGYNIVGEGAFSAAAQGARQ